MPQRPTPRKRRLPGAAARRGTAAPARRNALVTGAGRRIGLAIARALAADGWGVAVHYHGSGKEAAALVRSITRSGGRAIALKADLSRESHVQALIGRAASALGPLTCLVNNAAVFEDDTVASATRASWDAHIAINLRAPFVLMQAFARQLPARAHGNVINLLDQRVYNLTPHFLSYTVSKMGLWTLTRTLALGLAPRIRVNAVGPGPALPSRRQTAAQFARQCARMPLRRGTTPEEIADAVRFVLATPAMTGQMIALDGGQHLGWAQPGESPIPEE
jgi:NAD(P)-dependent dehydrogenase (short-subunit alcohol dehydrogenase family)